MSFFNQKKIYHKCNLEKEELLRRCIKLAKGGAPFFTFTKWFTIWDWDSKERILQCSGGYSLLFIVNIDFKIGDFEIEKQRIDIRADESKMIFWFLLFLAVLVSIIFSFSSSGLELFWEILFFVISLVFIYLILSRFMFNIIFSHALDEFRSKVKPMNGK